MSNPATLKYKVSMQSAGYTPDGVLVTTECTDYVPVEMLDVYVADARTRWQSVSVSDQPDSGPGDETNIPTHLDGKTVEDFT